MTARGPRRFQKQHRRNLYVTQGGLCAWCGLELTTDAEADHLTRWADGGPTDLWNGQLLHPNCHERKEKVMSSLRKWQRDFLAVFAKHDRQIFLLVAAVGAGKTRAGLAAFEMWAAKSRPDPLCVIVSPSLQILRGWARETASTAKTGVANLDRHERVIATSTGRIELLSVDQFPSRDLRYWHMTYGSLIGLVDVLNTVCAARPVFVILDEPHHAEGGDDPSAWGRAAQRGFNNANRILCPTATPYRTRGTALPFVEYVNDRVEPDYVCSRERAIREGYIRRLRFLRMDADLGWTFMEPGGATVESAISGEEADQALRLAIRNDDFIVEMLERAKNELDQRLREGFDGTMLVIGDDVLNNHAKRIDEIANELWPGFSVRATGDDPNAHRTIDLFRERKIDARCLVTVGMAGEGCDIPHLVTLCWLTSRRTQLFFTQATGRIVRRTRDETEGMIAKVILPDHPELARLAETVMSEEIPPLRDAEEQVSREPGPDRDSTVYIDVTVEDIHATALTGDAETIAIEREIDELAKRFHLPAEVVREIRGGITGAEVPKDETAEAVRLRRQIKRNVSVVAFREYDKGKYKTVQQAHEAVMWRTKELAGVRGRKPEEMTNAELRRWDEVVRNESRQAA